MPVNPLIPLSFRPTTDLMGPRDIISLQDFAQRQRLQQQEQQEKVSIQAALQQPGGVDPNGAPSLKSIGEITKIRPQLGLQLGQMREQITLRDLQMNEKKRAAGLRIEQSGVEAYDRYLQETGGNREEASRRASADRLAAIDELEKSGQAAQIGMSEQDLNRARGRKVDFDQTRAVLTAMGGEFAKPTQTAPRTRNRIEGTQEIQEEYDPVSRTWKKIGQGPRFKPDDTAAGAFGGKNGQLLAALAEKGVSLPAGFRSKSQQLGLLNSLWERNPNLSADQIAEKVKSGQISLGAEKKETQTAAGVAGRVGVAGEEITQFAPLVEQASKNVPRGRFVPINKLLQMSETNISDPNLKQLKTYINSLLNAYDQLAARGGTDKDKRAEAHALLTSAESHEALMSGIEAFKKEVTAAQKAADIASRPRSERDAARKESGKSDWVERAMKANPGMSREDVEAEGKRLGKI